MVPTLLRSLTGIALGLASLPLAAADWTFTYEDDVRPVAHNIGDDGSTYLVGNAPGDTHVVTRLRPDGAVAWRREHPGQWTRRPFTTLELGSDRLCLYGGSVDDDSLFQDHYVACYRLTDGEVTTRFAFDRLTPGGTEPDQSLTMMLADGGFVNLTARNGGRDGTGQPLRTVRHRRLAPDGAPLHDIVLGERGFLDVAGRGSDGSILFQSDLFVREYRAVDADGNAAFALADVDLVATNAQFAPDGTIHLAGQRGTGPGATFERRHFDANGQELSRTSLGSCAACFGTVESFFSAFTFSRSQVFLSTAYFASDEFGTSVRSFLARLSAPTFEIGASGAVRVDPVTNAPVVLTDHGYKLGAQPLDATTGATLGTRFLATCPGCFVTQRRVTDDGALRVVASTPGGDGRLRVHALANAFAARPRARVDQTGLRGAWYATYAPGQGFVVDYLPASNTLFVPWFTYTPNGGAGSGGLRWYSLQGQPADAATRATLDVFENSGGVFASAPETAPRRVGSATLEAYDCDSASLDYVFDGGRRGTITLTRLTPATEPCVAADGTTRGSRPPARAGFDARQSGAWFVPGRAGQGTLFTVQPGGLFFGAWFTYDPQGFADDPTAQHWFSMQGDLGGASDGTVTLPFYRTTGGALDGQAPTATVQVGTATVHFTACDRATLEYRFDADAADAFRSLAGTLALEKLGGCGP